MGGPGIDSKMMKSIMDSCRGYPGINSDCLPEIYVVPSNAADTDRQHSISCRACFKLTLKEQYELSIQN